MDEVSSNVRLNLPLDSLKALDPRRPIREAKRHDLCAVAPQQGIVKHNESIDALTRAKGMLRCGCGR
jgi:hypothetical protein